MSHGTPSFECFPFELCSDSTQKFSVYLDSLVI